MISNATSFVYNPQAQYLFKRAYALALGKPYQASALQYSNFPAVGSDGKILSPSPLRIVFDVEKNLVASPNKAKFQIYNLSTQSRQQIKKGYVLRLQAGYNGLIETLYFGSVAVDGLKTERKGSDIVQHIECLDGGSSIGMATLDKTYPPGTTLAAIIQDVATAMSTPTAWNPQGIGAGVALGIPNVVFGKGMLVHGQCKETLDLLLKPQGLRWSVENGNLTILPVNAYNGQTAIVVSKETGMIGTPSQNQYTEFVSLLNPKLSPGALVQLISDNISINGFYKINKAHYEGDTHDNKWQVTCQCIPMPDVHQTFPVSEGFQYNTGVIS